MFTISIMIKRLFLEKRLLLLKTCFMNYILILMLFTPLSSWASPFGFLEHKFTGAAELSTFNTNTNFDDNGNVVSVTSKSMITENKLNLSSTYDFSSEWGFHGDLNFKQVTSQWTNYIYSAIGPGELTLGSDFQAIGGDLKVIPDFFGTIPLSTIPGSDKTAFLGDGAFALGGIVNLASHVYFIKNALYGGIIWRSQGLSTQVPLGLKTATNLGRSFVIHVDLFGELSLGNDQYTPTPSARTLTQNLYNGGSTIYSALNPSFFAVKGYLLWNMSKVFSLSGGAQQIFLGQRVPNGTRFFVSLGFTHWPGTEPPTSHGAQDSDDDKFQVDTEGE